MNIKICKYTHTHTNTETSPDVYVSDLLDNYAYLNFMEFRNLSYTWAIILVCKLTSCFRLSAFFYTKYYWFFLASTNLSKIHYKHVIYCEEFSLIHSENFLQVQKELQIIIMIMLTQLRTNNFKKCKTNHLLVN
jgi:hypothetical protein